MREQVRFSGNILLMLMVLLLAACGSDNDKNVTTLTLTASLNELDGAFPHRFATITATARDSDGTLLRNATVEFNTTLGSFSQNAQVRTMSDKTFRGDANGNGEGQAEVRLYPASDTGTAIVTAYVNGIQQSVSVTITGAPELPQPEAPTAVTLTVSDRALFVAGVGAKDNTIITLRVLQADGKAAQDAPAGINNLKVSFVSQPAGGELLTGKNAVGEVTQSNSAVWVNTLNGAASITLNAGTLPGVLELTAEALDNNGQSYAIPLLATVSAVSIASGPAHSIAVTYPQQDAVQNLGNGIYRRKGGLLVTDRYGNKVTDGTVVNLGILDSVILSNKAPVIDYGFTRSITDSNAVMTADSNMLTDSSNSLFNSASITRNNAARFIESGDRVLVLNAQAEDKSRFVSEKPQQPAQLLVNKNYVNTTDELKYIVGASLLGAQVSGEDPEKEQLVSGQAVTTDGNATFYLTYPANQQTILMGCIEPSRDTRHLPVGSAQLWLVAEVSNSGATTIDNQGCFSALGNLQLLNVSGQSTLSSSGALLFQVRDEGDIALPFWPLAATVSYTVNNGGFVVTVSDCNGTNERYTNTNGYCELFVSISGGVSGDTAVLAVSADDRAVTQITIRKP